MTLEQDHPLWLARMADFGLRLVGRLISGVAFVIFITKANGHTPVWLVEVLPPLVLSLVVFSSILWRLDRD